MKILSLATAAHAEIGGSSAPGPTRPSEHAAVNNTSSEYESSCTQEEKERRIELYQSCRQNFSLMGLPVMPGPSDLKSNYSCPAIEPNFLQAAGRGCAAYLISVPTDIIKGLFYGLGLGVYDQVVTKECGPRPNLGRRASRTGRMSEAQRNLRDRWADCKEKTIQSIKEREASNNARTTRLLAETQSECIKRNPSLNSRGAQRRKSRTGRTSKQMKLCQLRVLSDQEIDCQDCTSKLFPKISEIEKSNSFIQTVTALATNNRCYRPEKLGALACEMALDAAKGVSMALLAVKAAKVVGKTAARRAAERASRLAEEAARKESRSVTQKIGSEAAENAAPAAPSAPSGFEN